MKVLVACEYSAVVRDAFRARGHDAWSCDILPTEGDPRWHFQGDAIRATRFMRWDLLLGYPPCTDLACSGAMHFEKKRADGRQQKSIEFFLALATADISRIAIENPVGIMSNEFRTPDQIIQPYFFGDEFQKTTCLWLKNLPPLIHSKEDDLFFKKTHVGKGEMIRFASGKVMPKWYAQAKGDRGKARSKTFQGIANAMAEQWGQLK